MKSAIELAMEKMSKKGGKKTTLTKKQKEDIADLRSRAKAKIAEEEIMLAGKIEAIPPGEEKQLMQDKLSRQIYKINEKMEADIEKVRNRKS